MFRSIIPIAATVIAIGVFLFYVRPFYEEIKGVQSDTEGVKETIAKVAEFNAELQTLRAKADLSDEARDKLRVLVPETINPVRIVVDLEEIANDNRVLFGGISVGDGTNESSVSKNSSKEKKKSLTTVSDEDFEVTDFSFSIIGTYNQIRNFLEDIERSLTLFEVSQLSFTVGEGELFNVEVTMEMFSLKN